MFRRNSGLRVKNTQLLAVVVKQVVESILFFIITYYVVHSFFSCPYLKFIDVHKIGTVNYIHYLSFHGTRKAFNLLSSTSGCILQIFNMQKNILKKSKPRVHS